MEESKYLCPCLNPVFAEFHFMHIEKKDEKEGWLLLFCMHNVLCMWFQRVEELHSLLGFFFSLANAAQSFL